MAKHKTMSGTLFGVGVGPGDPELMTVKAWRLLSTARAIAYLAANGGESVARGIAQPFLPDDAEEIVIDMPMRIEKAIGQRAYDEGCKRIAAVLDRGVDVVMLCEGDPFFYGSFMYVHQRLCHTYNVAVIPGVTSVAASAAAINQPLCERDESFKVLPATMAEADLRRELGHGNAFAILKVGRHFSKVRRVLMDIHLDSFATVVEKATHQEQTIRDLKQISEEILPYFTTIIVRKTQSE